MTWTFNTDNPTDRDRVRLLINDIDTSTQKFSDEIINMMLTEEGSVGIAASRLCRMLAQRYAVKAQVSLGPLSASYSEQTAFYRELSDKLESESRLRTVATPFAGGLATSADPMVFGRGMHDDPSSYPSAGN